MGAACCDRSPLNCVDLVSPRRTRVTKAVSVFRCLRRSRTDFDRRLDPEFPVDDDRLVDRAGKFKADVHPPADQVRFVRMAFTTSASAATRTESSSVSRLQRPTLEQRAVGVVD